MTTVEIKSDLDNATADIIKAAIQAEIKRLEIGLEKTERRLQNLRMSIRFPQRLFLQNLLQKT